jgi:hypothetical protein
MPSELPWASIASLSEKHRNRRLDCLDFLPKALPNYKASESLQIVSFDLMIMGKDNFISCMAYIC